MRLRSLSCLVALVVSACSPGSRDLRWEIAFADATLATRAEVVVGRILAGGCASGTVVYEDEAGRDETPSMPSSLEAGRYGFEGLARDGECVEFARGCVEIDLPADEDDLVLVRLSASIESRACSASQCASGRCGGADAGLDAGADGGPRDGGAMDAGSVDGGPMDGGPMDGGPMDGGRMDAGMDGGADAPVATDAPADAGAPRTLSSYRVGTAFVCAITTDGALWCWGANVAGQLGLGTSGLGTERLSPTRVGTGTTWNALGLGDEHICATLGTDLQCWGDNMDGQLLTGDMVNRAMPTRAGTVVGPFDLLDGATLGDHTCALRPSAVVSCAGQNDYGQLGLGDNVNHPALGAWTGTYRALSAGHHFTCAIRTDGALLCTGRNEMGQLGQGTVGTNVNVPTQVGTGLDWIAIDGGDTHVCGLRGLGDLYCWGEGLSGRLGTGAEATLSTPTRIGTASNWTALSSGGAHTCALRGAGELWCWGANDAGQLGVDTSGVAVLAPMRVGTATDWTSVRAGGAFTCGTRGAALYCWGANATGALGQGDTVSRSTPTLVTLR